jgi:hypothetical protein
MPILNTFNSLSIMKQLAKAPIIPGSWVPTILTQGINPSLDNYQWTSIMSADGNTIVAGTDENYRRQTLAMYRFVNNAWVLEALLTGNNSPDPAVSPTGSPNFIDNMAISEDGNVLVMGCEPGYTTPAELYTYVRNGTTWSLVSKMIDPTNQAIFSVAMSNNNSTMVISKTTAANVRTMEVYTNVNPQSSISWVHSASIPAYGQCAISDNNTFIIVNNHTAQIYKKIGATWTLTWTFYDEYPNNTFTNGISISSDGTTAVIPCLVNDVPNNSVYYGSFYLCNLITNTKQLITSPISLPTYKKVTSKISKDGNTIIITVVNQDLPNRAYLYIKSGSTYSLTNTFELPGGITGAYLPNLGEYVDINSNGTRFTLSYPLTVYDKH